MEIGEKIYVADKETLDKVYNILATEPVYGFIEHMDVLSPSARITAICMNKSFRNIARNASTGVVALNDWADAPWIKANKPYMVKADGTPDYMLDENDYTKKAADGSASDVSNAAYDGGAFSWFPKVYKHEHMEGNDRVVMFSMTKRDGYEPVGFLDPDNNELEGGWIPMFYGSIVDTKMKCIAGTQPCYNNTTAAEKTAIDNFGARARFFGGPFVETIIDILIMMAGTTNLQAAYGYGNCNGYDASLAPTNGVKQNAVIAGGQFYGTDDKKSLNKAFHSIVLLSFQQWMRDPYEIVANGRLKVSKNYKYDLTGGSYSDTGITVESVSGAYPDKFRTVPGYGAVPTTPCKGSSSTGGCDGLWTNPGIVAVALRCAACGGDLICGPRARSWNSAATIAYWHHGAAIFLQPPVGVAA